MNNVQVLDDTTTLAEAAATQTVDLLQAAVDEYGSATWVLAGGSTPQQAYKTIVKKFSDKLDWSKVTVVMGDERIGALDGPDNNWHAADQILGSLPTVKLRPQSDKSAEEAAEEYERQIAKLPAGDNGLPRLDLVWAGVGDDGHTLSLFPRHASMLPSGGLVTVVHDAPKPPADRITLSLRAILGTENLLILASGANKKDAVTEAIKGGHSPIALVASIVATREGNVTWLVDKEAAPTD